MPGPLARVLILITIAGGGTLQGQQPGGQKARSLVRSIVDGRGYQTELPGPMGSPEHIREVEPPTTNVRRTTDPPREARRWESGAAPDWSGVANVVLIVLAVLMGIALISMVITGRRARGKDASLAVAPQEEQGTEIHEFDPGEEPLKLADSLAHEGRFAEAIRALLAATIEALRERKQFRIPPWMTGRTIAQAAPLASAPREALVALVDAVERSLFAGMAPSEPEYERCVQAFRALRRGAT